MSAILSADDLNDFISPGVACIKPVETLPVAPEPSSLEHEVFRDDGPTNGAAEPAQISLTDCLACSGCVTSAEAVLVSLQSHAEVLRALDAGPGLDLSNLKKSTTCSSSCASTCDSTCDSTSASSSPLLYVASVSPQTRANLAAACGPGVTEQQAGYMLEHLLSGPGGLRAGGAHNNGFTWVVDTNAARDATLVLGADEVLSSPSSSLGAAKPKPLLTSSCPGWVCYAEKTHPHVLSYLSKVKSPQALTGTLLKTTLSRTLGIPADRIWHVAVMPCFDKKLEASREELMDGAWDDTKPNAGSKGIRDVDCVITSKEVLMLAESRGIDFFSLPKTSLPGQRIPFPDPVLDQFLFSSSSSQQSRQQRHRSRPSVAAGSSGGNLYFVLQSVLAQNPGATLHAARGRNIDVVEYSITAAGQETPIFKAARYYGFRNIQNLVRRLRPARPSRLPGGRPIGSARRGGASGAGAGLDFAYVEVMACPGGCTNGGGQIKVDDEILVARRQATQAASGVEIETNSCAKPGPQEQKAWLADIDEAYFSAEEDDVSNKAVAVNGQNGAPAGDEVDGISPSYVRTTMAHWAQVTGISLDKLVYTTYREVVSDVGKNTAPGSKKKGADAAEHVVQLASKIGGGW
ncbi:Cytosolic Fe-S cluster assembly factor nar1 [Sporothrix curviconia]|uniref:Nuclear architecture-related protein 1 n=1 Tax=Sporothrix curviconia TaxID=1260050 RepID=A0ABP0B9B4_9PEZI